MVVSPARGWKTVADVLAAARAKPGQLNYASAGNASAGHLAMEALKLATGMFVTHIPYRGTGPAMNDLIGGQVDVMCDQTTNTTSQIEGGRVKAFAVTTAKRLE
eukprot:gene22616-42957_t